MQLFIELFKAKPKWLAMSDNERGEYIARAGASMQQILAEPGVELVGVGSADHAISLDAGYDFYAVWKLPDRQHVEMFENGIENDRWYDYFEQVNASGELADLDTMIQRLMTL
jgi:hypothetical protein